MDLLGIVAIISVFTLMISCISLGFNVSNSFHRKSKYKDVPESVNDSGIKKNTTSNDVIKPLWIVIITYSVLGLAGLIDSIVHSLKPKIDSGIFVAQILLAIALFFYARRMKLP